MKPMKVPGADHPIVIEPSTSRIRVTVAGRVIADTRAALTLRESDYLAVLYVPRADVAMSLLVRTDNHTYCPYKGEASYYSIAGGDQRTANAAWTYEAPYDAVKSIEGYLAFYPDRVDAIEELPLDSD
jgi:uncharacterized protein (DUF427 family)